MSATHLLQFNATSAPNLYLSFDLGWTSWTLAFSTGLAQKPRLRTIAARDLDALRREIGLARQRFGLPEEAPVSKAGNRRLRWVAGPPPGRYQ